MGRASAPAACPSRLARLPRPADSSFVAFIAWHADRGGDVDDPDELRAQYDWMCSVMGWRADVEPEISPEPEPEPEQSSHDALLPDLPPDTEPAPAPIATLVEPVTPSPAQVAVRPVAPERRTRTTLQAEEAAERFVEWVQLAGRTGTYSSQELAELYREHCKAEDLGPVAENMLRSALIHIPGVSKSQIDAAGGGRGRGKRRRAFRWTIAAAATVALPVNDAEATVPWSDLPDRRVA